MKPKIMHAINTLVFKITRFDTIPILIYTILIFPSLLVLVDTTPPIPGYAVDGSNLKKIWYFHQKYPLKLFHGTILQIQNLESITMSYQFTLTMQGLKRLTLQTTLI